MLTKEQIFNKDGKFFAYLKNNDLLEFQNVSNEFFTDIKELK